MTLEALRGILIPFLGTSLGAACVIFLKGSLNIKVQKGLTGFAAGVMVAASIWSLIIPAIDQSETYGKALVFAGIYRILVWNTFPAYIGSSYSTSSYE